MVELPRMRVGILEVDGGGAATRVRFDFPTALEQLPNVWMFWDGRVPKAWRLPAIGQRDVLPAVSAVL